MSIHHVAPRGLLCLSTLFSALTLSVACDPDDAKPSAGPESGTTGETKGTASTAGDSEAGETAETEGAGSATEGESSATEGETSGTEGETGETADTEGESSETDGETAETDGETGEPPKLEIVGEWVEGAFATHVIDETSWTSTYGRDSYVYRIDSYDNGAGELIAQSEDDDTWSKFEWTYDADELYYCQVGFGLESAGAAMATPPGDRTDPAAAGCGGFAWSHLSPAE